MTPLTQSIVGIGAVVVGMLIGTLMAWLSNRPPKLEKVYLDRPRCAACGKVILEPEPVEVATRINLLSTTFQGSLMRVSMNICASCTRLAGGIYEDDEADV